MNRRRFLRDASLAALVSSTARRAVVAETAAARQANRSTPFPMVDGLSFLTDDDADLRSAGLAAIISDVSSAESVDTDDGSIRYYRSFEACLRSASAMRAYLRETAVAFLAERGSQIQPAWQSGRSAVFFQLQGLEPMGTDVRRLDIFYELGVRVLQITHHDDNPFGGGAMQPQSTGLTELGREAVARMNTLGIVPDVSHASDRTALDTCATSSGPVILSHGAARALVDNARCAPDEVLRAIADSGGAVGIFMMSFWLTPDAVPTVEHLIRQLRHVINVGGIESVGIANDYGVTGLQAAAEVGNDNARAVEGYLPWWRSMGERGVRGFAEDPRHVVIPELNDVNRMFTIDAALDRDGFSVGERELILGGNWIRVLTDVLG